MRTILLEDVVIGENRQRRDFPLAELNELGDAIEKNGLLHPIVLREGNVLVAGERRLRAIKNLFDLGGAFWHDGRLYQAAERWIPYVNLGDLDELAAEEAELSENIHRSALTWQEQAAATARLNALRQRIAVRDGSEPPSVAAISVEVRGSSAGSAHDLTRKELIVAKHLDDPEVRGAKSADEAFKLLKKKEATARNIERAAAVGATFTASAHRILHGDSRELLVGIPAETFDVIVTDPPYGMGADDFGFSGHAYSDSPDVLTAILDWLPQELFRVAKPEAHAYIFCDFAWITTIAGMMQAAGWTTFRTPLIWHNPAGYRAPWPEQGPQRKYECIVYAMKGKRAVNMVAGDVIVVSAEQKQERAAQKPVPLYTELLKRSARPGDKVLDCFAGTGPLVEAAHELKCEATLMEMDAAAYGICLARLERVTKQGELL